MNKIFPVFSEWIILEIDNMLIIKYDWMIKS